MSGPPERLRTDPPGVRRAAHLLRRGGVVAFPTDTVYGLAALADDPPARRRIYDVKRRPASLPLIVMAPELDALDGLVRIDERARRLADRWWPGPLTLVLPTPGGDPPTLGVRIPDHPAALALLRAAGRPLATTSANLSGEPAAVTADDAARLPGLAAVLDDGPAPGGRASTVLSLCGPDPEVLREGPISREDLLLPELASRVAQFAAEAEGESPLYATIAGGIARRPDVLALLLGAQPGQRRANLLLAAVHALLLAGAEHSLPRWYPSVGGTEAPSPAAVDAFADFALTHQDEVRALVATRRTQTNEVGRSAALALALGRLAGPIALLDAGCSAGLNLLVDQYRYDYGVAALGPAGAELTIHCELRGDGAQVPPALPAVIWRAGLDASPLDPADPEAARWLQALVWPDDRMRRERLLAALATARRVPLLLQRGDLMDDLPALAQRAPAGAALVIQHSAVTAYLSESYRHRFRERCRELGAHEISLEPPPGAGWPYSVLELDGEALAEADGHNAWIRWTAG
ncbi:MAG: L-threonylcarbamoyladenylate synthase [Candidatus Dormiibacterota bacterium]